MATISANAYNDAAARTAGEAITVNSGAVWTVRTDSRVHANAPASNLGSLAGLTITEGEVFWDSTAIRWMPYNTGSGNVPAIGTMVTQGGVTGYLLGVWAAINTAQTAVGAAMPASGFIKMRSVSGGAFAAGALTNIGASATGPDVQGWMEMAHDAASDFTVPRLGKHKARGGKFFLANTTGVRGQSFQVPTMGSAVMFAPGLMVETGVGTDQYEFWPGLNGATNGWSYVHVGNATGTTDRRQSYLLSNAGGAMIMGATWSVSATYASLAAQASTHAEVTHSCTYTWINNVVEVYYATGHLLEVGQQTGLDFTSGGATAYDGIFTVTAVTSPWHFTVALTGSGAGGNVTSKPGITISFTAHAMNIGESVYCDFTTGTPVDGTYEIYAVTGANTYLIKYPHVTALTSGNVSVLHTLVVTYAGHGLAVGQTVYCDFTSGGATDGVYVIKTAATTFNINFPHSAVIATSNVTLSRDIGYVPEAGRRTWIPSNILTEVATAARATNTAPNGTIGTRPEWVTTSAGAIDLEYVYGCSGYMTLGQAYSVRLRNCITFDRTQIAECSTPIDLDGIYVGMHGGLDTVSFSLDNNYAGGVASNIKAMRGNVPGTSDHSTVMTYCYNMTVNNLESGLIQYARTTGYVSITGCDNIEFNNCRTINTRFDLLYSPNITSNNHDHCDCLNGYSRSWGYGIYANAACHNLLVNNPTSGFANAIPNVSPNTMLYSIANKNVKLRNVGTLANPIPLPTWAPNISAIEYLFRSGGSNDGVKVQKCYIVGQRAAPFVTVNSDKNMFYESCKAGNYNWATKAPLASQHADLNGTVKNVQEINGTTGQASVYGTHFMDSFLGSDYGRFLLMCNEPSAETASQFTSVVGTAKFNSSGGVIIPTVNDQHYWTDPDFRKGHTGFLKTEPLMSGGTLSNYNLHYQIDLGSGFSAWKNLYYQRSGASGSSGAYTFTVTDATGVAIGDRCWGTGLAANQPGQKGSVVPRVTQVNGNTITVDIANTATVSGIIRFNHIQEETVDPAIGFKLKLRVTTVLTATAAISFIRIDTLTSAAAQNNYYPLDTNTLTITGVPTGCDLVVLSAGTSTILNQQDAVGSTSLSYTFSGAHTVDIGIIKPGYIPFYIRNLALAAVDSSLPVSLTPDRNYTA